MPIVWAALKRTCMVLGAVMLFSTCVSLFITYNFFQNQGSSPPSLPKEMVLYYSFEDGVSELPGKRGLTDPFSASGATVRYVVESLDKAANDPRVKGFFARLDGGHVSVAHAQELRAAVKRFRAAGKFAYIHSASYGDGGGLGGYYLASSFDKISMQPMGVVSVTGISAEMPFARKVLDKLGVYPQFYQRKEYKSAYESLTNEEMSEANRTEMSALIGDLRSTIVSDIAADRGISEDAFEGLVDQGLFTDETALAAHLVTKVDYANVLIDDIKEEVVGDREAENDDVFVSLANYVSHESRAKSSQKLIDLAGETQHPKVALVYAVGMIMQDSHGPSSQVAAADEIGRAVWGVAEDEDYEAIVLRIDSPGGSPIASESILHAIKYAQEKGKRVIVSMGPTAASGGYWIASSADYIFAMPTTITGSIGVVGGKFSIAELWDKVDVKWDGVKWGENAALWSLNTPFSESEAKQVNAMLDQVYNGFIARVAEGRKMPVEAVEAIAKGRVWSGKSAQDVGLVDQLGGLKDALDYTAKELGVETGEDLQIVQLPREKSPIELLVELLRNQGLVFENLHWQNAVLSKMKPFLEQISAVNSGEAAMAYEPIALDSKF